jgi:hypothetical protein
MGPGFGTETRGGQNRPKRWEWQRSVGSERRPTGRLRPRQRHANRNTPYPNPLLFPFLTRLFDAPTDSPSTIGAFWNPRDPSLGLGDEWQICLERPRWNLPVFEFPGVWRHLSRRQSPKPLAHFSGKPDEIPVSVCWPGHPDFCFRMCVTPGGSGRGWGFERTDCPPWPVPHRA